MADPTPIHRHPVGQVQQDSGLSRAAFYKRMAQAGVKPLRVGQNSFLEREHLEALRALEEHIQSGGGVPGVKLPRAIEGDELPRVR